MLRVAWRLPDSGAWTGGQNYFSNLAKALFLLPDRGLEIVLLGSKELLNGCESIPDLPIRRHSWGWIRRTCNGVLRGRDPDLEGWLKRHFVDVLSHSVPLGRDSSIPALCWVPDLQHKRMPQFFSIKERIVRDLAFQNIARGAQGVLFSSEDARKDFLYFYPKTRARTFVLPFVAHVEGDAEGGDWGTLKDKYNLQEPYFIVPNQLWKHKNHGVLVEALKLFETKGEVPLILCTGATRDYRHPSYFKELQARVSEAGLLDRMRFLGRIPLQDLGGLMRHALALINPSYFEGWSTSVEEAKSLGKRVILSDIPVHREQAPHGGIFFSPDRPQELYDALRSVVGQGMRDDEENRKKAASALPERMREYGRAYEGIVREMV